MIFLIVLCLTGVFGFRSVSHFLYWNDPQHQDQTLAGWMTPRYVGQSYNIPPEIVEAAFGITREGPPRRVSLEAISLEQGITLEQMQARVDAAVLAWRATHGIAADE